MSAIFGVVRRGDPTVPRTDLARMLGTIRHWGEAQTWSDEHAGLGAVLDRRTPGSYGSPVVLRDGSVVVATGRLDNAAALRHELECGGGDHEILAAAWERWGDEAPQRIHGDWSLAAWSPRSRRLFLARDPFGNTSLTYHHAGTTFAFAPSAHALFAAGVPRRLNEFRLAQHLVHWIAEDAATLHAGVFRLPPGHQLTFANDVVEVRRYWFPENLPDLRLSSPAAYVERFLELYDEAVRVRTRTSGDVAVALSSGLDSGSVAALAARELRERNRSLLALTAVPLYPQIARLTRGSIDEWELAHDTATFCGNIVHRRVTAEGVSPIAAIERSLRFHDEPEVASGNLHWMTAMFDEARESGATVLLTGQLGNGGISWAGDALRVIRGMLHGHWVDAWRGFRLARRQSGGSALRAAWTQVALPIRSRWASARFRSGRLAAPFSRGIAPQLASRTRIFEAMRDSGYDPYFGSWIDARAQRLRYLLPRTSPFGAMWAETSASFQLDVRDPTADVRLLEFCLAIPDDVYRDGEHDRLLIRRAMEGLLPPAVQWNRRRGRQAADLVYHLRADADAVTGRLRAVLASPLVRETLNTGALLDAWARMRAGITQTSIDEAFSFARLLHLGLFLGGLEHGKD